MTRFQSFIDLKFAFAAAAATLAFAATTPASAGKVVVQSNGYSASILNDFYNAHDGHTSTIASRPINQINLTGVNLFWSIQPTTAYNPAEIAAMQAYLANGGRIAFMGENGDYASSQNNNINAALTQLGASMQVINTVVDPAYRNATRAGGQILADGLTAGVESFEYAAFAPVEISGSARALMLGTDLSSVMMAYQSIGAGGIFLITDQNVFDGAYSLWSNYDNETLFSNFVTATPGPVPVGGVPEPATWAMMLLGFGAMGAALRRRAQVRVRYA